MDEQACWQVRVHPVVFPTAKVGKSHVLTKMDRDETFAPYTTICVIV